MKVLVTGGAGYIGSHAVYELISQGFDVVIIDNLSKGFKSNIHPNAIFYKVDLRNKKDVIKVFEKEKNIQAVMHFAGLIVVPESVTKPLEYYENNLYTVQILLEVMNQFNVKNIVFSSTAAVYGEPENNPIKEDDITKPINPYGESKLCAEMLIKSWSKAYKTNYVIFRYFNVAGANQNKKIGIKIDKPTHLVPVTVESVLDKNKIMNLFGNDYKTKDGSCIRDFIHVVDLVLAHILGLKWTIQNNLSDTFNLGSSKGYSVLEVIKCTQKTLNCQIKTKICPKRIGDPASLLASTTKVEKILNWKPQIELDQIIKSEYEFRKEWNKSKNKNSY